MLSKLMVVIVLVFAAATSQAALTKHPFYPQDFYDAYDAGDVTKLKSIIKTLLSKNQRVLTYREARQNVFFKLFADQNSKVKDVYCHETITVNGKTLPAPTVMNVEHTWPQSKFTTKHPIDMQKSDLNILYPVSADANTSRSNHPFGVVSKEVSGPCPSLSKRGYTTKSSDIRFEPPEVHQGNAARAIFYFALHYDTAIDSEEKADLLKWDRQDPVSQDDRDRNEQIQKIQGNRNPFVDYPELVELLVK